MHKGGLVVTNTIHKKKYLLKKNNSEWNFGGLPAWLLHIPDIVIRANNTGWKDAMSIWVRYIASVIDPYLAKNGGPIILAQIDNEYHRTWDADGYVAWCGNFANSLNFEIPWVMCNGKSANNTINTCNSNDCYNYAKNHNKNYPGQPLGWTENEGWFQYWETESSRVYISNKTCRANRSPQDMAYSVAIWFAAGGSHHNYYMWYGGNHISWTAGSGVTNYYQDGVNYHSDGLVHEPKRSHLNKLHLILAENQKILLNDNIQVGNMIKINNSTQTFAYVYFSDENNETLTFLVNNNSTYDKTLEWNGIYYNMPSNSISIIDNDGEELYNTAKIDTTDLPTKRVYKTIYSGSNNLSFDSWSEIVPLTGNKQNRSDGYGVYHSTPYEQIRYSNNTSEYLYYSVNISTNFSNIQNSMKNFDIKLEFDGRFANSYVFWLNDKYLGSTWNGHHNNNFTNMSLTITNVNLDCSEKNVDCTLTILSSMLGIDNRGLHGNASAMDEKGIASFIRLIDDSSNKVIDTYTNDGWIHWLGSTGENLNVW